MKTKHLEVHKFNPDNRDEWLKLRGRISTPQGYQVHFGGSDIGTILGLNKFKDKGRFFYECVGLSERVQPDNDWVDAGHILEPIILKNYWEYYDPITKDSKVLRHNRRNGIKPRRGRNWHATIINPKYPWLFYNPDGLGNKPSEDEKEILLEFKSAGRNAKDSWIGDISPSYICQAQTGALILDLDKIEIALLTDGRDFEVFPFDSNAQLQDYIITHTRDFHNHVVEVVDLRLAGAPQDEIDQCVYENEPEPTGSADYEQFLKERYKPENKNPIDGDEAHIALLQEWYKAEKIIKENKERVSEITNYLRKILVDHDGTSLEFGGNMRITWGHSFRRSPKLKDTIKNSVEEKFIFKLEK